MFTETSKPMYYWLLFLEELTSLLASWVKILHFQYLGKFLQINIISFSFQKDDITICFTLYGIIRYLELISYLDQILPQHESLYPIGLISARIKILHIGNFFT